MVEDEDLPPMFREEACKRFAELQCQDLDLLHISQMIARQGNSLASVGACLCIEGKLISEIQKDESCAKLKIKYTRFCYSGSGRTHATRHGPVWSRVYNIWMNSSSWKAFNRIFLRRNTQWKVCLIASKCRIVKPAKAIDWCFGISWWAWTSSFCSVWLVVKFIVIAQITNWVNQLIHM